MMNIPTKKLWLPVILSLLVGVFFVSCYPLSTGSLKWRIKWDKKLKLTKQDYLESTITSNKKQPNIILIVADDLGINEVSCYGNSKVETPYIDELAREGVKCEEGYVTSAVCAPSRCAILTGRYQQRCGFETIKNELYPTNIIEYIVGKKFSLRDSSWVVATKPRYPREWQTVKQGIPPTEISLAELLKKYNYSTGIIGKWHLGNYPRLNIPEKFGFDYQYGCYDAFTLYAASDKEDSIVNFKRKTYTSKYQWEMGRRELAMIYENNKRIKNEKQYLTDAIRDRSLNFIEDNKDKPFFLYIPFTAPHEPFQAKLDLYNKELKNTKDEGKAVYYAIIRSLDNAIGAINQKLKDLNLEENTMVIFLSDNGAATYTDIASSDPLKGGKLTLFEGGITTPYIFKWKNHIEANTTFSPPTSSLDVFTTVAGICNIPLPENRIFDGVNLMPYFKNETKTVPHRILYWRADHVHAIRKEDYILIFSSRDNWTELYNLRDDKNQKNNLMLLMPDKIKELKTDLQQWEQTLPAKPLWPYLMDHRFTIDGIEYLFPA